MASLSRTLNGTPNQAIKTMARDSETPSKCIHVWRFVGEVMVGKKKKEARRRFRCEKCWEQVDAKFVEPTLTGDAYKGHEK